MQTESLLRRQGGSKAEALRRLVAACALMLGVTLTFVSCVGNGSTVSNVMYEGATYSGGTTTGFRIDDDDLSPIGRATAIRAGVTGDQVYALNGVDPARLIIMRSDAEQPYWLFFRSGVLPDLGPDEEPDFTFPTVPGLCRYLIAPPAGCALG